MSSPFSLIATSITKHYGPQLVLADVSLSLGPAGRMGVVGPNGIGKSTLLKTLAGTEHPDEGTVTRKPPSLSVAYMPQEEESSPDETLYAYLSRRTGVTVAAAALARAEETLASDPSATEEYSQALDRHLALGGPDLRTRAERICGRVGLDPQRLDSPTASFSAGQASRAALASILLARHQVVMLDEPTNNLDFEGLEILTEFVRRFPGAVMVTSHDRAFLDECAGSILEITAPDHTAAVYAGGFSDYLEARRLERERRYQEHQRYLEERGRLEERLRRQKRWAEKGVRRQKRRPKDRNKVARDAALGAAENLASKVRVVEKRIERLQPASKPWEAWELRLHLEAGIRSGERVAGLEAAVVRRGSFTLGPVDLEIAWQDRVAILGPNGSGKSTLLGAITGKFPVESGKRWTGSRVRMGEVEQGREAFSGQEPLLATFRRETGYLPEEARSALARFGLGADHVMRPAATLSPGERTRATIAALGARKVNLMILDEPTNHLDLPAIEELEQALAAYEGTVILVTHDRWLLDAFETTRRLDLGDPAAQRKDGIS